MAHERRRHQALDRVVIEGRRQLAAHVEEVVELEDLDREPLVHALQLVIDEPALDGSGRAGGHALQERGLLVAERMAVGPRPQPQDRDRPVGLEDRAQDLEAVRLEHPGASPLLAEDHVRSPERVEVDLRGRPRREAPRRLDPVASALRAHEQRAARRGQLAHHDEEGGVEDLGARQTRVERGREVQQRDQLRHPLEQRRRAALAPEGVEGALVLEHDGGVHGQRAAGSFRLTRQQTLRRAERRNVTESMIFSIRWTPRPPVRRSLT